MHETAVADSRIVKLDPSLLYDLGRFVENKLGLNFAEDRLRDLERGICSAANEFGYADAESYIHWLLSAPLSNSQVEMLASHLTVGETYFFRDKAGFDALAECVLPDLIRSRTGKEQRIRIWSAGCSSGEEAYSIAILLDKIVLDLKEWSVTILATDINPHALKKATKGVYSDWSFRDTPEWIKEGYFTKIGKTYEVARNIRNMVTFSYHNLADDPYPTLGNNTSAMDIIFCRNVLMYFPRDRAREVVQKLRCCLVEGGWFVISPVETSHAMSAKFKGIKFPGATLYRKTETGIEAECKAKTESWIRGGEIEQKYLFSAIPVPRISIPPISSTPVAPLRPVPVPPAQEVIPSAAPLANVRETVLMSSLAIESANQGRLTDALEFCEKAIDADKLNPSLHYLQATILQEMHKNEEAVASLKRAIYLDYKFVIAHFSLGCLMYQDGKCREAGKHFDNASSLLKSYGHEDILPESEGLSARRLNEIIKTMQQACVAR